VTAAPDEPQQPAGRGDNEADDQHGQPQTDGPAWTGGAADIGMLDDSALQNELAALLPLADRDALKDPLTLAMHLDRRVVSRPHLRVIAAALAGLSPNAGERVLVTTPPQVGKTQLAQWGLFWWLCRHPSARVIIGSYGTQLATKRGRAIRKLVTLYGQRYGLAIDPGQGAAGDWRLTSGGGCRSAGLNAGITGEPADLALIDDPVRGRVDADSPTKREHAWNWWSGDLTSRLAPGAPVLLVMTRWHDDDVAARLLAEEGRVEDGGRWRVVHMPAIAVSADPDRGIAPDGLGRKPGEPLSHPRIPTSDRVQLLHHWEDKRRGSTPRDWGALYQGDPKPVEGALLDRTVLRERRCFSPTATPIKHAVAIDPSGGGRDTAGIVAGWLGDDRKVYLTHDLSGRMPTEQWAETACRLAYDTQADRLLIEANYGGDMARRVLRSAWQDLVRRGEIPAAVLPPQVVMIHARKGKMLRAEPIAHQIQLDNVRLAAPLPELEEEWATWQPTSSESPGRIDASVHLVLDLLPMASAHGARGPFSSAAGVSRTLAAGHGDSGMPHLPRDPSRRNVVVFDPSRYSPRRTRRSA
jgi:hypothetical protein